MGEDFPLGGGAVKFGEGEQRRGNLCFLNYSVRQIERIGNRSNTHRISF